MDSQTAETILEDYLLNGIAREIFFANEAKALCAEIGIHADQVNAQGYGQLFGSLQLTYSDRQTLCITKMFEPKPRNPKYKTRSIPTILDLIKNNAAVWSLPNKNKLQATLVAAGHDSQQVLTMSNTQISLTLVTHFEKTLPQADALDELSQSLSALKEARDKGIAHNEAFPQSDRTFSTWGGAENLVTYAKDFVSVVSMGFLSLHMGDDSNSYKDIANTRGTSIAMRQMLQKANLAE